MNTKASIEDKRRRIASLKEARARGGVTASTSTAASTSTITAGGPINIDELVSSLLDNNAPEPPATGTSSGSSVSASPSLDPTAGIADKGSPAVDVADAGESGTTPASAPARAAGTFVTVEAFSVDIPSKEVIQYSKQIQTSPSGSPHSSRPGTPEPDDDANAPAAPVDLFDFGEAPEGASGQDATAAAAAAAACPRPSDLSKSLRKAIMERIVDVSSDVAPPEDPVAGTLTDGKNIVRSPGFVDFFEKASRRIERALNAGAASGYGSEADASTSMMASSDFSLNDDPLVNFADTRAKRDDTSSSLMKVLLHISSGTATLDGSANPAGRWIAGRTATDVDWSPVHKNLFLVSYGASSLDVSAADAQRQAKASPSQTYDREAFSAPGLVIVWSLALRSRPEYIFWSHSPVTAARFSPGRDSKIIGGTASGQLLVWDMKAAAAVATASGVGSTPVGGDAGGDASLLVAARAPVIKSQLAKHHHFPICSIETMLTPFLSTDLAAAAAAAATTPGRAKGSSGSGVPGAAEADVFEEVVVVSTSTDGMICRWSLGEMGTPVDHFNLEADSSSSSHHLLSTSVSNPTGPQLMNVYTAASSTAVAGMTLGGISALGTVPAGGAAAMVAGGPGTEQLATGPGAGMAGGPGTGAHTDQFVVGTGAGGVYHLRLPAVGTPMVASRQVHISPLATDVSLFPSGASSFPSTGSLLHMGPVTSVDLAYVTEPSPMGGMVPVVWCSSVGYDWGVKVSRLLASKIASFGDAALSSEAEDGATAAKVDGFTPYCFLSLSDTAFVARWSPNRPGRLLAVGSADGRVSLFEIDPALVRPAAPEAGSFAADVDLSALNDLVPTTSIQLQMQAVTVAPGGGVAAGAVEPGTTGSALLTEPVNILRWHPDGHHLLAATLSGSVWLIELSSSLSKASG
ncbi:hypothetical protein H696_02697 [Fonticula alba]|uniref:Dynein intermediate chain, cytosolic n=1 Tax=Fonticula alba TaxID=691883 RepID=A0A058Z8B6_FONAL|nr:hypothetical protein H696_02697 [Fonticula alba]KCV70366.1 hypothetical protein H696_02697 [Fonticula alba]|eukprot:XP_009494882.1 hypothetical protein H696_02697 [Fonticula alba]